MPEVKKRQPACKPGSVWPARIQDPKRARQPFIWDACCQTPHATNPGSRPGNRPGPGSLPGPCCPYSVLLPVGFTMPPLLPAARWALTPPFHPYPAQRLATCRGGLLSVALSLRSPSPGVTRHRVSMEPGLSSPAAFRRLRQRLSGRLAPADLSAFGVEVKRLTRRSSCHGSSSASADSGPAAH